jgi:DNA-binding transcriptional LysR family regulator
VDKAIVRLFFILAVSACAQVTVTPVALEQYSIATSPELEPVVVPWLIGYRETNPNVILHLDTLAPVTLATPQEIDDVDLIITAAAPPEGWFATPLVSDSIVVIVHPGNPIESLSVEELADIFNGRITSWSALGGEAQVVEPVIPLEGEASRLTFRSILLSDAPFTLNALLAPNQDYMREMVAEDVGRIGFMLSSLVTNEVRKVTMETTSSGLAETSIPVLELAIDVLAIGREEPAGALREFLVWLQGSVLP